jgi:hypothetical protein
VRKARITRGRFLTVCALWLCSLSALADATPTSQGPDAVACEVLVILGHSEGTGIDPALEALDPLKKPPFDSFPKKTLLSKEALSLTMGKETEVALPNGRKLRLSLLERTSEGRYRVNVSINRPGKRDYLPLMTVAAAPGDPFFVAGQKHQGGTLIIGVSVGKKP